MHLKGINFRRIGININMCNMKEEIFKNMKTIKMSILKVEIGILLIIH